MDLKRFILFYIWNNVLKISDVNSSNCCTEIAAKGACMSETHDLNFSGLIFLFDELVLVLPLCDNNSIVDNKSGN